MAKKFEFPECGCKFIPITTDIGETSIICNEWNAEHNCNTCGFNPTVGEARLFKKYRAEDVIEAITISKANSMLNPDYVQPSWM